MRTVTLRLCHGGALPPFPVESPWWPDVEPVVAAARARFGVDVFVLRLLDATTGSDTMGGPVTYLAETDPPSPGCRDADDHPLRAPWARPGGVAAILRWADSALAALGHRRTAPAVQVKSWNLSLLLRLTTTMGEVWCKSVPPFFAHEATVMRLVARHEPGLVPAVLAATDRTALLAHVPGEDQFHAGTPALIDMVGRLVELQATVPVAGLGSVPDWRAHAFPALAEDAVRRTTLTAGERAALDRLVAGLPRRFADLAGCGLPDTLVHGDFHPGNWRTGGVLLDWGDSGIGHPLLDLAAFLSRIRDPAPVRAAWLAAWRRRLPGSDPARAAELIEPIAALRQAVIYRRFLDGIEPAEHRYHESDVPHWLRTALASAGAAGR